MTSLLVISIVGPNFDQANQVHVTPTTMTSFGIKQTVGLYGGPVAGLVVYWLPFSGLSQAAHLLGAILVWVVVYWMTEPIPLPVTALLGTAVCVVTGLGSVKEVYANFAHPIIFLFMGSFFIAEALTVHGVHRRMALWILSRPWVGSSPARVALAVAAVTAFLSMWISNTAAAAIMLPITLGILATIRQAGGSGHDYETGAMLLVAYGAGVGGVATLIGTPPNVIGVGFLAEQAGYSMTFFSWMAIGLPISVLMLALVFTVVMWLHPPPVMTSEALRQDLQAQREALRPWQWGEIHACLSFGLAVTLWILPGLVSATMGGEHPVSVWLNSHLPKEVVAVLAASVLFFLPVDWKKGQFTLTWKQAANINWGTILLFGGGLSFGHLMVTTNLAATFGEGLVEWMGVETMWGIAAMAIVVTLILTELASNTAAASMLVPVVIAISQAAGVSPLPPTLAVCMAASLAFVLPVSTPPNAIVYGSGFVSMTSMVRAGLLLDLFGGVLIWGTLRVLCPMLGLI